MSPEQSEAVRVINLQKTLAVAHVLTQLLRQTDNIRLFDGNLLNAIGKYCLFDPTVHDTSICIKEEDVIGLKYHWEHRTSSEEHDDPPVLQSICRIGDLEIVQSILHPGCEYLDLVLRYASQYGRIEVVKHIIREWTQNSIKGVVNMDHAMMKAAENGHIHVVEYLADHASIEQLFLYHTLRGIVVNGHVDMLKYLVDRGADTRLIDQGHHIMREVIENGHVDMIRYLANRGANIRSLDQRTLDQTLIVTVKRGYTDMVKYLVQCGANMKADGYNAVFHAVQSGSTEIVKIFVDYLGADKQDCCEYALYWAAERGYLDIVHIVAKHSPYPFCAIREAAENGYEEVLRFIVEELDLDQQQGYDTALYWAVCGGQLKLTRTLVETYHANVRADQGRALDEAAANNRLEIVQYLVSQGADVNADYALAHAAGSGYFEVVKLLVENGANVEANEDFAIRRARKHGYTNIAKYLLAQKSSD